MFITTQQVKLIEGALDALGRFMKKGVRAVEASRGNSQASKDVRYHLACSTGLAVIAGVSAVLMIRSMSEADRQTRAHQSWLKLESDLDRDLDSTFDASDPIAKY